MCAAISCICLACGQTSASADYQRLSDNEWHAVLHRDSVVIDSLARLINTDSLYRTHERMRSAKDPTSLVQMAACERARLTLRYGVRPAELAVKRMEDTLWPANREKVEREIEAKVSSSVDVDISNQTCGHLGPLGPDSVAGVSLQYTPTRYRRLRMAPPK